MSAAINTNAAPSPMMWTGGPKPPPPSVRIAKIILRDFRAFPNSPETYEFDLGKVK